MTNPNAKKMQQKCKKNDKILFWNFQCLQAQDFPKNRAL
jgi:hypothetical protein